MGRTRLAKALVSSLQRNKEASQSRKNELVDYLKRLNQAHANKQISGAKYVETLTKKTNGRNIKEWVDYYENYSKNCEKAIERQKAKVIRNRVLALFFGVLFLGGFIFAALSLDYSSIGLTGFFVGEGFQEQEYSQIIGLITNESTNYELNLENPGQLSSVKINGEIKGEGEIKVYLNDLLILDSSKIKSKSSSPKYNSPLTGMIIEETETITTDSQTTTSEDSYSETETPSKEDSSPSQEESLTETTNSQTISSEVSYSEEKIESEVPLQEESSPSQEEPQASESLDKTLDDTPQTENESISYSETETPSKEESSPSQEESLTETNQSYPQRNQTEDIETNEREVQTNVTYEQESNETQSNISYSETETPSKEESSPSQEESLTENIFNGVCEDTCNLEKLSLTNSSYTLRVEIEGNATLRLGSIDYSIILEEVPIILENITINTIQYDAVLGQPVKWKKQIELPEKGNVKIELPKGSEKISVSKIIDRESYSEKEASQKEESSPSQGKLLTENKKIKERSNSIEVLIEDNSDLYEIEYETPAPYSSEEETEKGKKVIIAGSEEVHYENVLAFTNLSESLDIRSPSELKIYWIEEEVYLPAERVEDKDNNGFYDYVEWIVPHLSNQTFLITIQLGTEGKDAHIDSSTPNRNFGASTSMIISNTERMLLEFDLSDVTETANIVNANLTFYLSSAGTGTNPISVYRINNSWIEGTGDSQNTYDGVTWTNRSGTESWDIPGGDFDSRVWAIRNLTTAGTYYTLDITQLVQNWVNGTYENYGIILYGENGHGQWHFPSSDNINATIRPQLNITYNESQVPVINSVSIPSTIREGENLSLTANITDNLEVEGAIIEIDNLNYSLGQNPQTISNVAIIRPAAKGTIETNRVVNYLNSYDNNNDTSSGINAVNPLLTIKTSGVSVAGIINSVKVKVIHSKLSYDTIGYLHWASSNGGEEQGLTHEFNSTSETPEITEFDVTSERDWSFADFNLLTEIHLNNSESTLKIYEVWFEVNYTTPASNDLWNGTINTSGLSAGNYTYTIFANDSSDNLGSIIGNITVLPPLVLMNVSLNDAQGNFQEAEVIIYNTESQEVEMNSTMTESELISVEEGEKDILINPVGNPIFQIEYENTLIENYTEGIIDIDQPSEVENFTNVYALNPHLNTNATVTVFATGNELYKCQDWNFTEQTCYGEWIKVMDITPGETYNFTLNPEDPAFAEVIVIIFAHHLNSTRDFISDIYQEVVLLDDIWSEEIPDGDYVRVTFESNLTSDRDITVYPRIVSGTPRIEIYEVNESTLIAEFNPIINNSYNKRFLTSLIGEQDTFDLRIIGGSVEFDYIVDPPDYLSCVSGTCIAVFNITTGANTWQVPTEVTEIMIEAWGGGGAGGGSISSGYGGGGGAGGQYAKRNLTVTPSTTFNIFIASSITGGTGDGSQGYNTSFFNSTGNYVVAMGGEGGKGGINKAAGAGGLGSISGGVGTTIYGGGNGYTGSSSGGGGGGGSGTTGWGGNSTSATGGIGTSIGGGDGGAGNTDASGDAGLNYGGAGGGGEKAGGTNGVGGTGAQGMLKITYAEPVDLTSPQYNSVSVNNTLAGQITNFAINVTDNIALHPNGQYIFSTNNTGAWVNDSAVNFTSTPSWANVTKTLNSTSGAIIGYRWYFKDSYSTPNYNSTPVYTLTTTPYYGILNVSIILPANDSGYFTGNTNLTINASVTCVGGAYCGTVSATARYNLSSASPDTNINISEGGSPFYNLGSGGEDIYVYNFSGITNPSSTHKATNGSCSSFVSFQPNNQYEFYNEGYSNLVFIDGFVTKTSLPSGFGSNKPYEKFDFKILESKDSINEINLSIYGRSYSSSDYQFTVFVYNYSGGIMGDPWKQVSSINLEGFQYHNLTFNKTTSLKIDDIIGSDGIIQILVKGNSDSLTTSIEVDFIEIKVNGSRGASNPQTSSAVLNEGESFYPNWTINVTSTTPNQEYLLDVLFNSSYGNSNVLDNNTEDRRIILNPGAGSSECGSLDIENKSCTLTGNISSLENGFNITAQNITLDCGGYYIIGDNVENSKGILINSSNITIRDCKFSNFPIDVYVENADNITLYNITGGSEYGLIVNGTTNSNFTYISFNNITIAGILVTNNSHGNTFTDININSSAHGIYIDRGQNNTFDCANGLINYSINGVDARYGIYTNQFNTTIRNCNIIDGNRSGGYLSRRGIYLDNGDNSTLFNNYVNTSNSQAIYLSSSDYVNLTNNSAFASSNQGIRISSSSRNILINNNVISSSQYATALTSGSSNNTLINHTAIATSDSIRFESSSNNNIFINTNTSGRYGFHFEDSSYNNITDCIYVSGSTNDVYAEFETISSTGNIFLNCSYDSENTTGEGNQIIRRWYYKAYVNDSSGNAVEGANITAYNTTGDIQFTALTNLTGHILVQNITEYVNTSGTVSYYNNYTVNASKIGYINDSNEFNFTITQNKVDDFMTLEIPGPADCTTIGNSGTLDVEGQTYTLTENISSQGTCLTVSAANVTVDCNGYWITFSTGGAIGTRGVYTNQFNTTVKNCRILDGNWTNADPWRAGVFFTIGADYGLIQNVSTNVSNCHGIDINGGSGIRVVNSTGRTKEYHGIIIWTDTSNITIINSTGISNTSAGIGIYGNNNSIYNSTGQSTYDGYGFYIDSASNNLISGCNASSNLNHGIYLRNSTNNTLISNNATSSSSGGIVINSYSSNNTLIGNNATSNTGSGIYILAFSNNNTLLRNNATTNSVSGQAIYIYNSSYMNLTENKATSTSSSGIYIEESSDNNTLTSNNGTSYAADNFGIVLGTSSNNILINNTGMNVNNGIGIYVAGSSNNNTLINNTGISSIGQGIYLFSNYNNTFINQRASGNLGIFMVNVNWTTFRDCIDISGTTFDVNLFSTPLSKNNTFINCSYDSETVGGTDNELIRKWYYQAYVNDSSGSAVSDANVSAYNATGVLQSTAQTNASGWIARQEVTEYVNNAGTRSYYNNYSIFANKSGYTNDSNIFNFTITQNKVDDWFTLTGSGPADCTTIGNSGSLDTDNGVYTLTSNITSSGTCLTVAAANVTIDCNGYWINYSTGGGATTFGITTNQFNTTIKNCNIVDGAWGDADTDRDGIYLDGSSNSNLINNSINVNNSPAIYLNNYANSNFLINNTIKSGYTGIFLYQHSSYNTLIDNNVTTPITALYLYGNSSYNNISNNSFSSSGDGEGIYLASESVSNIFINNNASSNTGWAIRVYDSEKNLFYNPIAITHTASGWSRAVYLSGANHTIFKDCKNINGVDADIYVYENSLSTNNTFINCSYDSSKEVVNGANNYLIRKWYYLAYVNYSNETLATNANVTAYNSTGQLQFTAQTNASGHISRQEIIEYINTGGTPSYYSNYTIFANLSGTGNATGILNLTDTQNKMDDFLTLDGEDPIPPTITINYPTGTIADVTPLINVSSSESGTIWYTIDSEENITLCESCTSSQNKFLYLEEGTHTVYFFANDSSGNTGTSSNSFTIDMNYNYYDNFYDNSSIFINNDVTWYSGTVNFTGGFNYLNDANLVSIYLFENSGALGQDYKGVNNFTEVASDPAQNTTVPPGFSGYSIELDGNDEVCNVASFNAAQNHTSCWWSYPSELNDGANQFAQTCFYDTWTIGTAGIYQWRINNCGSVSQDLNIEGALHLGEWTQFCQTYDSSSINRTVYINGVFNDSIGTVAIEYDGSQQWCIGGFQAGGFWTGNIYKPMWFDRILTSDEILSIYSESGSSSSGNFTSYAINTTENITSITNVTWTELNTDAENNITVQVSADGGITWYAATSGSALGQTFTGENNSIVYRVIFSGSNTIGLSDMNISWSSGEANTAPQIVYVYNSTEMTDISDGPNEGPIATYVQLNFTAYDEQGFDNLDDSSVQVNFSLAGESSRVNSSCALLEDYDTNYANYTCNVTMWWWDAPGVWTINASISDTDGNDAFNDSTTFAVGSTTGFLANSTNVDWPSIGPGSVNIEALSPMLLNNTGNEEINVEVNSTNLTGESNSAYALGASNFSVHTSPGCGGTQMFWHSYTTVVGAVIPKGNYSLNDGTAQETIYFCLEESNSNLISQAYSTRDTGSWTIRIFLVLVTFGKRRRKKKEKRIENDKLLKAINLVSDEMKEEYSQDKEEVIKLLIKEVKKKYHVNNKEISELIIVRKDIDISINIFANSLGALEALVKYMKENLNMNYAEIARKLGRDERTIWTAYKKASDKQKEAFKVGETGLSLPISIFEDENLTILEAVVLYLKEKGKKYSEIGKLLNRDQRNIWTIYSKAIDKR